MDFLILFSFADFLSENPSNFTEFNVKCKKNARSWISNFTYFIWVGSLRNNALGSGDVCAASFAKCTGGWLKTGLLLKSNMIVKVHISRRELQKLHHIY